MSRAILRTIASHQSNPFDLPKTIFNHQSGEFSENFNRLPFIVSHNLPHHPLFEIPRLVELAKRLWCKGKGRVVFQEGQVPVNLRWEDVPSKALSFMEGISRIKDSGSWVSLKRIHEDPEYKALIDQCLEELAALTGGDLLNQVTSLVGSFFIASPHSVTPYHIDHEANFLLQIYGERKVYVCDPNDRSVLTEEEIENFYTGEMSAAQYSAEKEEKAYVFPFTPGNGAHIPSKSPHWARGGEDYSIALSINVCLKELDLRARVFQFNYYLRKLKMQPASPGKSALKDRLKIVALGDIGKRNNFTNNYEMITRNVKRLDRPFRVAEKLLGRSSKRSVKT